MEPQAPHAAPSLPAMDVVICTLNSAHSIEACVRSALREIPVRRIHVVDGGSTDGTLEILARFPEVTVHARPELSLGESRAFSFGLVESEYFVQLDSDVVLREGWGAIAAREYRRGDVVEFGTIDHYEFPNPSPSAVGTPAHERRAFFFVNTIRREAAQRLELDVTQMEEELARRIMRARGYTWVKTGITHADQYSRPVRYQDRLAVRIVRRLPFPPVVFYEQGRIDGLTEVTLPAALRQTALVMAREVLGPIAAVMGSIGNPFRAALHYLRGYRDGRRAGPRR